MDYLELSEEEISDLERAAYASGDTDRAALLGALHTLMLRVGALDDEPEED